MAHFNKLSNGSEKNSNLKAKRLIVIQKFFLHVSGVS